jgi:hypothetical protein
MKKPLWAGAAALALLAAAAATVPTTAQAAGSIPIVTLAVAGDQATVSQATMRPGVVEFRVGKTFVVPGPQGGPDALTVVATDQLDVVLADLGAVFGGNPEDPASLTAAAAAMRDIHSISTWYGGAGPEGVWQVNLPAGTYTVFGVQSTAMGMAKPVTFTVAGAPRTAALHATQATFRAVGDVGSNKWTFRQAGDRPVEWITFANSAKELHFLDAFGVKPSTTSAMVRKAVASNAPPKFATGTGFHFDVISPGVRVAIKGELDAGTYVVDCFIPSESDGMPHAVMGMWKLITVS